MLIVLQDLIKWVLALGMLVGIIAFCMFVGTLWAKGVLAEAKVKQVRKPARRRKSDGVPYDGSEFVDDGTFFDHV